MFNNFFFNFRKKNNKKNDINHKNATFYSTHDYKVSQQCLETFCTVSYYYYWLWYFYELLLLQSIYHFIYLFYCWFFACLAIISQNVVNHEKCHMSSLAITDCSIEIGICDQWQIILKKYGMELCSRNWVILNCMNMENILSCSCMIASFGWIM